MVEGKAEGYNVVGKPNPVPENKQLLIIPGASHCDLYDGGYTELEDKVAIEREKSELASTSECEQARPKVKGEPKNMIPWDKLAAFFEEYLK